MEGTSLLGIGEKRFFVFLCLFGLNSLVSEEKTKFVFRFFDLAMRFYSACFIHDIHKFEDHD